MENAAVKPTDLKNLHQAPLYQIRLAGKIQSVRKHEKKYYTAIVSPAIDEYSSPSRFEVRSDNSLGDRDDVVNVMCFASGRSRSFQYTDKDTGDKKTGFNFDVFLAVIE